MIYSIPKSWAQEKSKYLRQMFEALGCEENPGNIQALEDFRELLINWDPTCGAMVCYVSTGKALARIVFYADRKSEYSIGYSIVGKKGKS